MDLKQNHLAHVRYTKSTDLGGRKGEVTDQVIIPTYIPGDAIKALDVSHLSETQALEIQQLQQEYIEYVEAKMKTIYSFEDWIDHTQIRNVAAKANLKYRTFKSENLEVITAS